MPATTTIASAACKLGQPRRQAVRPGHADVVDHRHAHAHPIERFAGFLGHRQVARAGRDDGDPSVRLRSPHVGTDCGIGDFESAFVCPCPLNPGQPAASARVRCSGPWGNSASSARPPIRPRSAWPARPGRVASKGRDDLAERFGRLALAEDHLGEAAAAAAIEGRAWRSPGLADRSTSRRQPNAGQTVGREFAGRRSSRASEISFCGSMTPVYRRPAAPDRRPTAAAPRCWARARRSQLPAPLPKDVAE